MSVAISEPVHGHLPCGIEYGVLPLMDRHVVSFQIRMLTGICNEPAEKLGVARLVTETIDKGTASRTGQELLDSFDAIGASHGAATGRETTTYTCTVLPEHFDRAVALHAEFLRTPTFPPDAFAINLELGRQELVALEDDAQHLADKLIGKQAYGSILGRHPLGEPETLERIEHEDLTGYWQHHYCGGRMLVAVAGAVEPQAAADTFQKYFDGFGSAERQGRGGFPVEFTPGVTHHDKALEQEQIGVCWPGVEYTHPELPTQQVVLRILSGGMSGRLFTEVREKQGLVYWVGAWQETPRGSGMMFMGASTTPERCDRTYATLLREVDRLAEDLHQDELDRAVTGVLASRQTRGDTTRSRCHDLSNDLFYFGRPVPEAEKIDQFKAVSIDRIRRYLDEHPRDRLCVLTLGPRPLAENSAGAAVASAPDARG